MATLKTTNGLRTCHLCHKFFQNLIEWQVCPDLRESLPIESLEGGGQRICWHTSPGEANGLSAASHIRDGILEDCWFCVQIANVPGRLRLGEYHLEWLYIAGFLRDGQLRIAANLHDRGASKIDARRNVDFVIHDAVEPLASSSQSAHAPAREQPSTVWDANGCTVVRDWLRACDTVHTDCHRARSPPKDRSLPTRLIAIADFSQGILRLTLGESLGETSGYVALSHCWGGVQRASLRRSNFEDYQRCIPLGSLPKTFSQAAQVCHDLGIAYLWIDTLCIVQDDWEDWKFEASRMAEVYSRSCLTIAASAATSDEAGLFQTFDRNLAFPLALSYTADMGTEHKFVVQNEDGFESYVRNAPLSSRAWVLQESELSWRTVHFAKDQLYWNCASEIKAQFGSRRRQGGVNTRPQQGEPKTVNHDSAMLVHWEEMVQEYSRRKLTLTSDKLVAIAGLAYRTQMIMSWSAHDYLAGLWRQGLPHDLLWYANGSEYFPRRLEQSPSWSWASVNHPISSSARRTSSTAAERSVVEILSASTQPSSDPYGWAATGSIVLRGDLCRMRASQPAEWIALDDIMLWVGHKWTVISGDGNDGSAGWLDVRKVGPHDALLLAVLSWRSERQEPHDTDDTAEVQAEIQGLMLVESGTNPRHFRRVGMIKLWGDRCVTLEHAISASRPLPKFDSGQEQHNIVLI